MQIRNFEQEAEANRNVLKTAMNELEFAYNELTKQKKQAEQWKAVSYDLAQFLEVQCSLLPYYNDKKAEDFIEQAKRRTGYGK